MSSGMRTFLAIAASLVGLVMFLHGTTAEEDKAWFSYVFGAFCMFIAATSVLRGRAAKFCGSLIGLAVFITALWYLKHELMNSPVLSDSRSQPSVSNAVLVLLVFGIPSLLYVVKTRFGFNDAEAAQKTTLVTKDLVFGTIGSLWGGALIIARLFGGPPAGSTAYQSGSWMGTAIGVAMFAGGIYYLRRGLLARKASEDGK